MYSRHRGGAPAPPIMLARMAVIYAAIEFPADGKEKFRLLHYSSYAVSATLKSGVKMEFLTLQNKFYLFEIFGIAKISKMRYL